MDGLAEAIRAAMRGQRHEDFRASVGISNGTLYRLLQGKHASVPTLRKLKAAGVRIPRSVRDQLTI